MWQRKKEVWQRNKEVWLRNNGGLLRINIVNTFGAAVSRKVMRGYEVDCRSFRLAVSKAIKKEDMASLI